MKRHILLLSVLFPVSITEAAAETVYHPSFVCPRPDNSDLLANKICDSSDMSKADLMLNQVYYALRWQDGPSSYQNLKEQAIKANMGLRDICGIPQAGSNNPLPGNIQTCYIQEQTNITTLWKNQLSPPALEEASRNIDQHIALEQKLIDTGYVGGTADGVYGDIVRNGIVRWQKAHDIEPNGFLTNKMASMLDGHTIQTAPARAPIQSSQTTEQLVVQTQSSNGNKTASTPTVVSSRQEAAQPGILERIKNKFYAMLPAQSQPENTTQAAPAQSQPENTTQPKEAETTSPRIRPTESPDLDMSASNNRPQVEQEPELEPERNFSPMARVMCSNDAMMMRYSILPMRLNGIPIDSARSMIDNVKGQHWVFMRQSVDLLYKNPEIFQNSKSIEKWKRICMHDIQGY